MDQSRKTRNSFIVRLLLVACVLFAAYQVLIYFFGGQPPVDEALIGDFADRRIDRFYQGGDNQPLPGTELPPIPEQNDPIR